MTDPNNLFIEFHALRSYAPGNLNRDELGTPKTAMFGGVRRLRISSQCLKRTWRTSEFFRGQLAPDVLGVRTKQLPKLVREALEKEDVPPAVAEGMTDLLRQLGKSKDDDGTEEATAHLLYLSQSEIEAAKGFAKAHRKELEQLAKARASTRTEAAEVAAADAAAGKPPKRKRNNSNGSEKTDQLDALMKDLRAAFTSHIRESGARNAVDIALFGRFLTSEEFTSVDAAMQVAHALGTQKVDLEYDYFSAVDDHGEGPGAGMIGESEFASSVFYEYAVCDWRTLVEHLHGDAALAANSMKAVALAIARAVPKGKANGTAPQNPADYLEVVVRKNAPISLANAFVKPVRPTDARDVMESSIDALRDYGERCDGAYSAKDDVVGRFVLTLRTPAHGRAVETRRESLDALAEDVRKKLIEPEAKE